MLSCQGLRDRKSCKTGWSVKSLQQRIQLLKRFARSPHYVYEPGETRVGARSTDPVRKKAVFPARETGAPLCHIAKHSLNAVCRLSLLLASVCLAFFPVLKRGQPCQIYASFRSHPGKN